MPRWILNVLILLITASPGTATLSDPYSFSSTVSSTGTGSSDSKTILTVTDSSNSTTSPSVTDSSSSTTSSSVSNSQNSTASSTVTISSNSTASPTVTNSSHSTVSITVTDSSSSTASPSVTISSINAGSPTVTDYSSSTTSSSVTISSNSAASSTVTNSSNSTASSTVTDSSSGTASPSVSNSQQSIAISSVTISSNSTASPTVTNSSNASSTVTDYSSSTASPSVSNSQASTASSTVTNSSNSTASSTLTDYSSSTASPSVSSSQNSTASSSVTISSNSAASPTVTNSSNSAISSTVTDSSSGTASPSVINSQNSTSLLTSSFASVSSIPVTTATITTTTRNVGITVMFTLKQDYTSDLSNSSSDGALTLRNKLLSLLTPLLGQSYGGYLLSPAVNFTNSAGLTAARIEYKLNASIPVDNRRILNSLLQYKDFTDLIRKASLDVNGMKPNVEVFTLSPRFTNQKYSTDLANRSSPAFKELEGVITNAFTTILKGQNLEQVVIASFRNGSVIADTELTFPTQITTSDEAANVIVRNTDILRYSGLDLDSSSLYKPQDITTASTSFPSYGVAIIVMGILVIITGYRGGVVGVEKKLLIDACQCLFS